MYDISLTPSFYLLFIFQGELFIARLLNGWLLIPMKQLKFQPLAFPPLSCLRHGAQSGKDTKLQTGNHLIAVLLILFITFYWTCFIIYLLLSYLRPLQSHRTEMAETKHWQRATSAICCPPDSKMLLSFIRRHDRISFSSWKRSSCFCFPAAQLTVCFHSLSQK